ncbi:hypothetical protein [Micromonospora sp. NPDC126480]|uniref:hypothetical protein n=1 Tax=Micromonospora sp. NPDC126480 TaxID=3155312 RepID=UPI00332D0836
MARWGIATTALLAAVALGVGGCGPAPVTSAQSEVAAVDVTAAMGAEGLALAALGFDPAELDVTTLAAPASPQASPGGEKPRRERAEERRERRQARVLLRRNMLHGEAVVQTKDGTRTVAVQRGEVTAIDGRTMTVKSSDGFTMNWTFGPELRVLERRDTVQPEAVEVGRAIGVAGFKDGESGTARLILLK